MILSIIAAAAVLLLDQGTKYWFGLRNGVLIPGVVELTFVMNEGISLGLLAGSSSWILTVTALAGLVIAVILLRKHISSRFQQVCLGMVIGGGIGNLIDRLRLGYVTDLFNLLFIRFYVFNVADAMIVVGMILLGITLIREERHG